MGILPRQSGVDHGPEQVTMDLPREKSGHDTEME